MATDASPATSPAAPPRWPAEVRTLAVDVGGSGVKAAVLDATGEMLTDRVRVPTPYPCPPDTLVDTIRTLTDGLPAHDRVSVGFPGLVRSGRVLETPALSRTAPEGRIGPDLAAAWAGFPLQRVLQEAFGVPLLLLNDADMQGCAVVHGEGLEFVMTLGTGCGTALFHDGHLLPHLELSHGLLRRWGTYDNALGDAERQRLGNRKWSRRVRKAVTAFDEMLHFDRLYVGGGNARHLTVDLAEAVARPVDVVSNSAGIRGGVRAWDLARPR